MISKTHSQEGSRGPIRYPSYQVGGRGSAVVLWAGCCCARRPVSPAFRGDSGAEKTGVPKCKSLVSSKCGIVRKEAVTCPIWWWRRHRGGEGAWTWRWWP